MAIRVDMIMSEYENYNFYKNKASMNRLGTVKTRLIKLILPVLAGLEDKGWQPVVAQGLRSLADQQKAIDAGNSSLSDPRRSKHVIGEAVDITDARYGWEGPASNLGYQFWKDLGQLVNKTNGLTWGGDWGLSLIHISEPTRQAEIS